MEQEEIKDQSSKVHFIVKLFDLITDQNWWTEEGESFKIQDEKLALEKLGLKKGTFYRNITNYGLKSCRKEGPTKGFAF